MIRIDDERLFEGSRKLKFDFTFGVLFFLLLFSSLFFAMLSLTGLPVSAAGFAKYQDAIIIFGISTAIIATHMCLLFRYYRHLYFDPVSEMSNVGKYKKPTPNKCLVCGRHPVSKEYHIRQIHGIKIGEIEIHYENCGCKYCLKPIQEPMGVGF